MHYYVSDIQTKTLVKIAIRFHIKTNFIFSFTLNKLTKMNDFICGNPKECVELEKHRKKSTKISLKITQKTLNELSTIEINLSKNVQ